MFRPSLSRTREEKKRAGWPLEEILRQVEKPARYIGGEWNAVRKDPEAVGGKIALAFPDVYEIGMSYLGQKILYAVLNGNPAFLAERVFAPWPDLEQKLRSAGLPLFSLESQTPLRDFDIVGFSLLYELNYSNVLTILDLGRIPLLSAERGEADPLVIAGGPSAFNPEPVSDFFDAFLFGDGEEAFPEIAKIWVDGRERGVGREKRLEELSGIAGVYVPRLYESYAPRNSLLLARRTRGAAPAKIKKRIIGSLGKDFFPEDIVVPDIEAVFDRVSIEVGRGCPQRCRFCQATNLYFPFRVMSPSEVKRKARRSLRATGFEDVSLSALSVSDYPHLEDLVAGLMDELAGQKVSLSLSSLRPRGLSPAIADSILKFRKTGFTLVPEAGTDRLRRVINKHLTDQDILEAAANAFRRGWRSLKLYFMVGLPTETQRDLEGLAELVEEILRLGKALLKTAPRINLSLSSFIPKPHTAFQWLAIERDDLLREKQRYLRSRLGRRRSVAIKDHPVQNSILEAVFSRGDRRLGPALVRAWLKGARFDSWKDYFEFGRWEEAFRSAGLDYRIYLGPLDQKAALPWDHVETGIKKSFLLAELKKALREELTDSCLEADCAECRGCQIRTRPRKKYRPRASVARGRALPFGEKSDEVLRYEVFYSKKGPARFLSHRDLATHLRRNLRRARIEVAHSKGFHPKMRISYAPALPLGMAAAEDCFEFRAFYRFEEKAFLRRLNRSARQGIRFLRLRRIAESAPSLNDRIEKMVYSADLRDPEVRRALTAERQTRREPAGTGQDALRDKLTAFLKRHPESGVRLWLDWRRRRLLLELPSDSGRGLRPQDIAAEVLNLEHPAFVLTRERLVFREDPAESPPG